VGTSDEQAREVKNNSCFKNRDDHHNMRWTAGGLHHLLVAALAIVTVVNASLEQDDPRFQWITAVAQTATHHGDSSHPTVRYSHDAVVWNDQMIVTHGTPPMPRTPPARPAREAQHTSSRVHASAFSRGYTPCSRWYATRARLESRHPLTKTVLSHPILGATRMTILS
jgi:hypothetical protein